MILSTHRILPAWRYVAVLALQAAHMVPIGLLRLIGHIRLIGLLRRWPRKRGRYPFLIFFGIIQIKSMNDNNKVLPELHDWEIIRVSSDRFNETIEINLHFPETDEYASLLLEGVKQFFLSGMMIQNVILDLLLFETKSNSDYFKYCCNLLNIDPSVFSEAAKTKIIYFEPSVGAELACCFTNFKYDRHKQA